uniref:Uncharacterized protein n=1 Tax=Panagrolaimus sp. ES5 TaxID=591445 RepID=A0AC34G2J5_9BILA
MNLEEAKEKTAEHGFDINISPVQLLVKLANYVAKNYEISVKISEKSNPAEIGTHLNSLLSNIGGASEDLLSNSSSQQSYSDSGFLDEAISFFANHLDSSLLFALEKYEDPELPLNEVVAFEDLENLKDDQILPSVIAKLPLNEVVAFEDLENLEDDQILPSVIAKIKSASSNTSWLFNHELSEKEWKCVNRHLKEINMDNCRRLLMLLLRLDVTVMSFFGSPRLESLEEKIREVHHEGKANLVIPKCAGICDLLVAEPTLLNIEKIKGNARSRIKQYMLEEAPPTRGASHRLQISSGAADPSSASRGRNAYRGRGGGGGRGGHRGRGRGNFRQHYSKRENEGLQKKIREVHNEGKANLVIPKCAGICDLLVAEPTSRGRNAYRGRGGGGGGRGHRGRGRGNFRQHYSKRENEGLQSQVYDEIDRQLAASEGPKRKRNKN